MDVVREIVEWIREFQTLLAGAAALGAAWIAYSAAMRAVSARHQEARRAAAAAFFAELSHCEASLIAAGNRVGKWDETGVEPPPLLSLDTEVFDDSPSAVGLLPGDEAYAVVHAYKLLKEAERERSNVVQEWPVAGATKEYFTSKIDSVRSVVHATKTGIRETAGINSAMADTVDTALSRGAQELKA